MLTQIVEQTPYVRCFRCGSEKIAAVCHHCGRALCSEHTPDLESPANQNSEFAGLKLGGTPSKGQGVHCGLCKHPSYLRLILLGLLIAILALVALYGLQARSVSFVDRRLLALLFTLVVAGLALAFAGVIFGLRHSGRNALLPLPILGRSPQVTVIEHVEGRITLDDLGNYRSFRTQSWGEINFRLWPVSLDSDRLRAYHEKYRSQLSPTETDFSAGYLALLGAAPVEFEGDKAAAGATIPLGDTLTHEPVRARMWQPAFLEQWKTKFMYKMAPWEEKLPIQIIPTLVQFDDTWALDLDVQVRPGIKLDGARVRVERLLLRVPAELGILEVSRPVTVFGEDEEQGGETEPSRSREIVWEGVDLRPEERIVHELLPLLESSERTEPTGESVSTDAPYVHDPGSAESELLTQLLHPAVQSVAKDVRYRRFFLRFANDDALAGQTIAGNLVVRFYDRLLSGFKELRHFSPLGTRREEVDIDCHTDVQIKFSLDLGCLKKRDARMAREIVRYDEGVIPDQQLLVDLVGLMAEAGLYVKHLVENRPQTDRSSARIINRFWEVAGRLYLGVYPLDFHLVVTGYEAFEGDIKPDSGRATFDLSVRAVSLEKEMQVEADLLRRQLRQLIIKAVGKEPEKGNIEILVNEFAEDNGPPEPPAVGPALSQPTYLA